MKPKQILRRNLQSEHEARFAERRLTAAFLRLPSALPCIPEPRHLFDNVARGACAVSFLARDVIQCTSLVWSGAIATGNPQIIADTERYIAEFFDELRASVIGPQTTQALPTLDRAVLEVGKEVPEALTAVIVADKQRDSVSLAASLKETDEAIVSLAHYRERVAAECRRAPMRVMR